MPESNAHRLSAVDGYRDDINHEEVLAVRRELRRHEMAFLELMRAGDVEAACLEAESAEVHAEWLRRRGFEPVG